MKLRFPIIDLHTHLRNDIPLHTKIARESERFEEVLALFGAKFDSSMVAMLKKMMDFNLFELEVKAGEATFGFGDAYLIGGENMDELVPRRGGGHQSKE